MCQCIFFILNLVKFCQCVPKILSVENQGPLHWYKCAKMICNNPKLNFVNINTYEPGSDKSVLSDIFADFVESKFQKRLNFQNFACSYNRSK